MTRSVRAGTGAGTGTAFAGNDVFALVARVEIPERRIHSENVSERARRRAGAGTRVKKKYLQNFKNRFNLKKSSNSNNHKQRNNNEKQITERNRVRV